MFTYCIYLCSNVLMLKLTTIADTNSTYTCEIRMWAGKMFLGKITLLHTLHLNVCKI